MLVEGAVEWIIEDVLTVVNGDWEMMTAIFVLELDTVRGVVQCVNFHGFYFCPYRTIVKCFVVSAGCRPGLRKPLGFQPGAACSVIPCTPCAPWIFLVA